MKNFNEHIDQTIEEPEKNQDLKSAPESDSFLNSLFLDDYEEKEKIESDSPSPSFSQSDLDLTYKSLFSDDYGERLRNPHENVIAPFPRPELPDDFPFKGKEFPTPQQRQPIKHEGELPIVHATETLHTEVSKAVKEQQIDQQDAAIDRVESGETSLDSTQEKGNYGEMKTDQDLREKGCERLSNDMVTDIDNPGHQGIDGVYYNPDGHPQYIIVDAKYGSAQLSETSDGKQMSDNWIDKRLDDAVGKEKADEIRMEKLENPENVGAYVSHVDESGNVSYDKLDGNGNVEGKDVEINA